MKPADREAIEYFVTSSLADNNNEMLKDVLRKHDFDFDDDELWDIILDNVHEVTDTIVEELVKTIAFGIDRAVQADSK